MQRSCSGACPPAMKLLLISTDNYSTAPLFAGVTDEAIAYRGGPRENVRHDPRRRRGRDADISRRRVAAMPWLRRGYSEVAATPWLRPRRRVAAAPRLPPENRRDVSASDARVGATRCPRRQRLRRLHRSLAADLCRGVPQGEHLGRVCRDDVPRRAERTTGRGDARLWLTGHRSDDDDAATPPRRRQTWRRRDADDAGTENRRRLHRARKTDAACTGSP